MTLREDLQDTRLAWLLLVGLCLRCAAVPLLHQIGYTSDEREYLLLAERLLSGEGFVDSNGTVSVRAPLYPALLAGLLFLDGGRLSLAHLLGVILGGVVILQTYLLAFEWTGRREIARWSAGVAVATPGLITYSALLQTEALAIPFFLGWLIVGARLTRDARPRRAALLGFLAGAAALTRAVFLPFAAVYAAAFIRSGGAAHWRTWRSIGVATALLVLLLLPWGIRNFGIHGAVVPVSTFGGSSFLLGNNPYSEGTTDLRDGFDGWFADQVEQRRGVLPEELTEIDRSELSVAIARDYIVEHPGRAAVLALRKAQVMLAYPVTNTATELPLQLGTVGLEFIIALLGAFGIASALRPRGWVLAACGVILFFVIMHTGLHAEARYRLPALPVIAVCAGAGATSLRELVRGRRRLTGPEIRLAGVLVGGVLVLYGVTAWMFLAGSIT